MSIDLRSKSRRVKISKKCLTLRKKLLPGGQPPTVSAEPNVILPQLSYFVNLNNSHLILQTAANNNDFISPHRLINERCFFRLGA